MADLEVVVDGHVLAATWTDDNPETRAAIQAALPLSGEATRWGDELYVRTPVEASPTETTEEVPEGALAYWPGGNAACLFWGPTPASTGEQPRAAAPVGIVAHVADTAPLTEIDGAATMELRQG